MKMRQKYENGDMITWLQVHNLLPIVAAIISAVSVYYALSNKVDLQHQQVEYLTDKVNAQSVQIEGLQGANREQELSIKELQVQRSVKGVHTFAEPSQTPVVTPSSKVVLPTRKP